MKSDFYLLSKRRIYFLCGSSFAFGIAALAAYKAGHLGMGLAFFLSHLAMPLPVALAFGLMCGAVRLKPDEP